MGRNRFYFRKMIVENTRDIDMTVKDAFGIEHILWPGQKRKIIVLKKKRTGI